MQKITRYLQFFNFKISDGHLYSNMNIALTTSNNDNLVQSLLCHI